MNETTTHTEGVTFDGSYLTLQVSKINHMLRNIFAESNDFHKRSGKFTLYKNAKVISIYEGENNIFDINGRQGKQKIGSGNFGGADDLLLLTGKNAIQHGKINNLYGDETQYDIDTIPIEYQSLYEANVARSHIILEILVKDFGGDRKSFFADTSDIGREYETYKPSLN